MHPPKNQLVSTELPDGSLLAKKIPLKGTLGICVKTTFNELGTPENYIFRDFTNILWRLFNNF